MIVTPPTGEKNQGTIGYSADGDKGYFYGAYSPSKVSYNADTGKVTVTGNSYNVQTRRGTIGSGYAIFNTTMNCTVETYLVYTE